MTKDCLSCVYARCGFIINAVLLDRCRQKRRRVLALCSSAAAAVAVGQLQLQPSHYSLVALQAFASRNVTSEGASKKIF